MPRGCVPVVSVKVAATVVGHLSASSSLAALRGPRAAAKAWWVSFFYTIYLPH